MSIVVLVSHNKYSNMQDQVVK